MRTIGLKKILQELSDSLNTLKQAIKRELTTLGQLLHLKAQKYQLASYMKSNNINLYGSLLQQFNFWKVIEIVSAEEAEKKVKTRKILNKSKKQEQQPEKEKKTKVEEYEEDEESENDGNKEESEGEKEKEKGK